MENKRRHTLRSAASRVVSALESAGLATTATFAAILWIGIALPGLPLVPGLGGGGNRNLAISLDSALLGVQDRVPATRTAPLDVDLHRHPSLDSPPVGRTGTP